MQNQQFYFPTICNQFTSIFQQLVSIFQQFKNIFQQSSLKFYQAVYVRFSVCTSIFQIFPTFTRFSPSIFQQFRFIFEYFACFLQQFISKKNLCIFVSQISMKFLPICLHVKQQYFSGGLNTYFFYFVKKY